MQSFAAILSVLTLATSVSAHGRLITPPGLPNSGPLQDIRVTANSCGQGVTVGGNAVASFKAGATQEITWTVDNGDGAGPFGVFFDPTGKGTSFSVKAEMVKNMEGQNGGVANSFPAATTSSASRSPPPSATSASCKSDRLSPARMDSDLARLSASSKAVDEWIYVFRNVAALGLLGRPDDGGKVGGPYCLYGRSRTYE
ncbi:hypothetical protein PG993_002593 [Apiospora rasikravindrae]|uniref:Uncharacterized protein n=1 Tax=Apiospora rasikravindrae TaxID=990691 RepID=A0ABR1TX48_9PEZI